MLGPLLLTLFDRLGLVEREFGAILAVIVAKSDAGVLADAGEKPQE